MISTKNKTCNLRGDFNIDILKYDLTFSVDFLNTLCVHKPTRITKTTATLIHNIVTNFYVKPIISDVILTDISDHFPVLQGFMNSSQVQPKYTLQYCKFNQKRKSTSKPPWLRNHGMRFMDIRMLRGLIKHL